MNRRTFIAGMCAASTVTLAGCSNGDDSGSTTTGTGTTETTAQQPATETTGTTNEGTTTEETTSETTETTETTTQKTDTRTVAFGESITISNELAVAVTNADTSDSYDHDGTTTKASDGKTFLLVTFEAENSGQSAGSLPEDASVSVEADDEQYELADEASQKWNQYTSSSVDAGSSTSVQVAFEVPNEAVSSFGVTVRLSYTESGSKQVVRWNME